MHMDIIITKDQLNRIMSEQQTVTELGHNTKQLDNLIAWGVKFYACYTKDVKNGIMVCPPENFRMDCYTVHRSDKGMFDLMRAMAKWFGVKKQDIERAYREWRPIN